MRLKELIGSGGKMWRLTLPFLVVGLILNFIFPSVFSVGGPSRLLRAISVLMLVPGLIVWIWSVVLIVTKVPRKELITTGPYALVRHPIYTAVSLLVIPSICFLLNSWLGVFVGIVLYIASRIYAPDEEKGLSAAFGPRWDEYLKRVKVPWL